MTRRLSVLLFLQVTAVDGAVAFSRPRNFISHRRSSSLLARYSPSTTVECQSRRTAQTTARAASNVAEPSTLKWRPIHTGSAVPGGLFDNASDPTCHICYKSKVMLIRDGKPKFAGYPAAMGGTDDIIND